MGPHTNCETSGNLLDPYINEPSRHVKLRPAKTNPFNAEPPPSLLVDRLITPNNLFYVRNHFPVPDPSVLEDEKFALKITMEDSTKKELRLKEIKDKFPKLTITAALQCAGNRRSEMFKVRPGNGISWGQAAIGNATWSGALLCDVLKYLGYDENNSEARHVQFVGIDECPIKKDENKILYGVSIPIEKATDPRGDVLLAYEMNGQDIPRDHGYPLRVIVPGTVGARWVKWLGHIIISKYEYDGFWQQKDYKGFAPNEPNPDYSKSPAIQELPVISAICEPLEGETLKINDGKISFKGYAWSGGGRKIVRVDVSVDGGEKWQSVEELDSDEAQHPRAWGWTLWKAQVPVSDKTSEVQLCVKAVDSQYNTQPENFENIWNYRGVLCNAYHRVNVKLTK